MPRLGDTDTLSLGGGGGTVAVRGRPGRGCSRPSGTVCCVSGSYGPAP